MRIWQGFKKIETFNQMVTLKCLDKTRKPPFKMFRPPLMGLRPPFKVFKYSYNALKLTDKVLWFWAVFFLSTSAQADLEGELDKMFNDLHNTTRPKAYMTERRGVISGGSIVQRNYIRDLNPITMTAPRIEAGCGGIDLYGGSFSYINKDEFVNFLRQVAQNARRLGPSLDGTQGIVGKLGQNNGAFSAEEITFINALPPGAFARIRTLASLNVGGTVSLVEAQARILALTMVKSMALSYLTQAEASLKLSGHAYAQIAREQIKTSRESIEREAQELTQSYGTNKDILELYELLLRASQVNTYLESTALE